MVKKPTAALIAATTAVADGNLLVANLLDMSEQDRFNALYAMPMETVVTISTRATGLANSCYEVLASRMTERHGKGWEARKYGGRVLTDLEKAERDKLKADIEALFKAFQLAGYSNPTQAIKYVMGWAAGTIGKKREPNQNKPRSTAEWLKAELPKMYRRLNKAEDVSDTDMALYDAIGDYLKATGHNLRQVLGQ